MELNFQVGNDSIKVSDLMSVLSSYPTDDFDLTETSQRYQAEIAETANRVFLVAKNLKQEILAYVQLILVNADNDPDLANGAEIAHIHDLRVFSELQGRGVGQSLVKCLEDEAQRRGIKTLTLGVDNWNARAVNFYDRLGYKKFKESPGRTDEEVVFLMRKSL